MSRILIRFTLAPSAPAPLLPGSGGDTLAPFGRWLRERVASAALDWPAVAVHRLHFTATTMELILLADATSPPLRQPAPLSAALGLARTLARELDLAARRSAWVPGPLWNDLGVWVAARGGEIGQKMVKGERGAPAGRG